MGGNKWSSGPFGAHAPAMNGRFPTTNVVDGCANRAPELRYSPMQKTACRQAGNRLAISANITIVPGNG
jgi:hypothetical protein